MSLLKRLSVYLLGRGEPDASKVLYGDGWWRVPSASGGPATQVLETSGPTTLTIGAIADGEFAKRVGATLVGAAAGGGGAPSTASYVVIGLDGTLANERKLIAGAGISITDGGAGGNVEIAATGGPGGGPTDAQVTLDFSTGKEAAEVSIADAAVVATTRVSATLSIVASADKTAEEVLADPIWVAASPVAGVGIVVYGKPLAGGICNGKYLVDVLYQ